MIGACFTVLTCLAASLCLSVSPVAALDMAYGIMVYQKSGKSVNDVLHAFDRTLQSVYVRDRHVYTVHTDIKSDPALLQGVSMRCASLSNCVEIPHRNVAWAGLSTGEMMLALMQAAFESNIYWEYFVLLGHESVSLLSPANIERVLQSYPNGTNFVNCWKVDGYNFFGQNENNTNRLEGIVVDDFAGGLIEGISAKRRVPEDMVFYKSLQQMVLSRQFTRYILYSPQTRRVMLYLANVKTADEMLIPTLLHNHPNFSKTAKCDTTLQFSHWIRPGGSWHPEYLSLEHLPQLINSRSSWVTARKIDSIYSKSLLPALDTIRSIYTFTPPHLSWDENITLPRDISPIGVFSTDAVNEWGWLLPMAVDHIEEVLLSELSRIQPSGRNSVEYRESDMCCEPQPPNEDRFCTEDDIGTGYCASQSGIRTNSEADMKSLCIRCDEASIKLSSDKPLLSGLSSWNLETSLCVGSRCGKLSTVGKAAANALLIGLSTVYDDSSSNSTIALQMLDSIRRTKDQNEIEKFQEQMRRRREAVEKERERLRRQENRS
mmetsp:Transcript_19589/g.28181  ORF Transcript_19589/g.28181 Transcript_19589/m.28181 type:complete len:546 (+) Transcript_19589:73-1710(+)